MDQPSPSGPIWKVLGLVDRLRQNGSGWSARCPAHEDRDPSLSIKEGLNGKVLLYCHAGCTLEAICTALGLDLTDLFDKTADGYIRQPFKLVDITGRTVARHIRVDKPDGDKDLEWERNGKRSLGGLPVESLPLYGLPVLLAAPKGATVFVCEGEKAAQALIDVGAIAVGTSTGASATPNGDVLAPLLDYKVILWPDNDSGGQQHMERIAAALNMSKPPLWLEWPEAPPKGDAADFFAQGGTLGELTHLVRPWRPAQEELPSEDNARTIRIVNAVELLQAQFKPPRWAVPDLLMEGLAILAGRPKLGKSWLALNLAADVSSGATALGKIKTVPGEVLYLALEDGERRMQERLLLVLGDRSPSPLLHFAYEWPKFDKEEGGMELLVEWIQGHPAARLIVIDTFKRVRPVEKGNKRLYDLDYDALAPLAALAREHGIAIVVVFHARKGEAEDPLDLVSGTTGLSGAVDAVFVLRRERGQADASLFVTGRDIEERDMALKWHGDPSDRFWWEWIGEAQDFRMSAERKQIVDIIEEMPGCKPADIAGALGKPVGGVRYLLFKMVRESQVRCRGGCYYPTANAANAANAPTTANPNANEQPRVSDVSTVSAISGVSGVSGPAQAQQPRNCPDCGQTTAGPWALRCDPCQKRKDVMSGEIEELPL